MANLVSICKKIGSNCPISRDIQLQNFQGRNTSNFLVATLENQWLHKFILTLSDLQNDCKSENFEVEYISPDIGQFY